MLLRLVRDLTPRLTKSLHKGQGGRIGVLGGSKEYTGAPFFVGMSAHKLGADLTYVFCSEEAAIPIKSYSPELIVHPVISLEQLCDSETKREKVVQDAVDAISPYFERLHALVIGPGMGRHPLMLECAARVLEAARKQRLPVIVDGDGLFLVTQRPDVVQGNKACILTPNVVEFKRLLEKLDAGGLPEKPRVWGDSNGDADIAEDSESRDVSARSRTLKDVARVHEFLGGPVIVQKGQKDFTYAGSEAYACNETGALKRSGGQGDVLCGLMATFVGWTAQDKGMDDEAMTAALAKSAFAATCLLRWCSKEAFRRHGRALLAGDIIECIGPVFASQVDSSL